MPYRGIQHVDLAVSEVDRSLAFYLDLLGPLGLKEEERYSTYRGTEEVVYLSFGVGVMREFPTGWPRSLPTSNALKPASAC